MEIKSGWCSCLPMTSVGVCLSEFIWGQNWLMLRLAVKTNFNNEKYQIYSTSTLSRVSFECIFYAKHRPRPPWCPFMLCRPRPPRNADPVWMESMLADLWPFAQLSNSRWVDSELRCSRCPPFLSLPGPIITSGLLGSGLFLVHIIGYQMNVHFKKSLCSQLLLLLLLIFIRLYFILLFLCFSEDLLCLSFHSPFKCIFHIRVAFATQYAYTLSW